jgi:hypothetical protein
MLLFRATLCLVTLCSWMALCALFVRGETLVVPIAQCAGVSYVDSSSPTGVLYAACSSASSAGQSSIIAVNGSTITQLVEFTRCKGSDAVAVNALNENVLGLCASGTSSVVSYNGTGIATLLTTSQCISPRAIVALPNGDIIVACSATIVVIDHLSGAVTLLANGSQCPSPLSLLVHPITSVIYAGCSGSSSSQSIVSIEGTTITTITNASSCANAYGLSMNPVTGVLYAACRSTGIISIAGTTVRQLATVSQCTNSVNIAFNPVDGKIYAVCYGTLIFIDDTPAIPVVKTLTTNAQCQSPNGLTVNPISGAVYATCQNGVISALACAPGQYITPGGSPSCTPCVPGTFQSQPAQTSCPMCSPGRSSLSGWTTCVDCAIGKYSSQNTSGICALCPTGRFQALEGQGSCSPCAVGTFGLLTGQSSPASCAQCPPGTQNPVAGSNQVNACVPCPSGSASSSPGQALCALCAPGFYQADPGTLQCLPCPADTYQPRYNVTTLDQCRSCPPSSSSPPASSSLSQCIPDICPPGLYSSHDPSGTTCSESCPAGAFCLLGVIQSCPAGTSNNKEGSGSPNDCLPCPQGSAAPSSASVACTLCSPGFSQQQTGALQCHPCLTGTYAEASGALSCTSCPTDLPQSPVASSSITQCTVPFCPGGFYTKDASSPCQAECQEGYYCVNGLPRACEAGSYTTVTGQSACTGCGLGMYGITLGGMSSSVCLACPLSTYSNVTISGSCAVCSAGMVTGSTGSKSILDCVLLSGCSVVSSSCPIASSQVVTAGQMLSDSAPILQRRQLSSNSTSSVDTSAFYAPLRSSASLRLAAFQTDAVLSAASATGSTPNVLSQSDANTLTTASIPLIVALVVVAFVPWLLYRKVPATIARYTDQFNTYHKGEMGKDIPPHPTQFGTVVSWSFLCIGVLVGVLLGTAPNTQITKGIVPPSEISTAGLAAANFQLTMRAHSGQASVASSCGASSSGSSLTSQTGFVGSYTVRAEPSSSGSACNIAADCIGCGLTGAVSSVGFTFPYDAQLIEYEVWVNSASPGAWSRRYGVLQQLPGQLLDAEGRLLFSLSASYYTDNLLDTSGFELEYQQYQTISPQSLDTFNGQSRIRVEIVFTKSDVIYQTIVSSKLSTLQSLIVILSALGSLFSGFALLFAYVEKYILKRRSGRIDKDPETGHVYVMTDEASAGLAGKKNVDGDRVDGEPVNGISSARSRAIDSSWVTLTEGATIIELTSGASTSGAQRAPSPSRREPYDAPSGEAIASPSAAQDPSCTTGSEVL